MSDVNSHIIKNENPYGKMPAAALRSENINKFIWQNGVRVIHEKTTVCPNCFNTESNHGDINCTLCDNGRIHFDPRELFVLYTQKHAENLYQMQGIWEMGDAAVTFPSAHEENLNEPVRVDYFDKITIQDFSERSSDLIKRSTTDTDKMRYITLDVLKCIGKDGTEYFNHTDFIVRDTQIQWLTSRKPATGTVYSLSYLYRPAYRVVNFLHESRYYMRTHKSPYREPIYLPIQCQVRRDYILDKRKNYD